MKTIPRLLGCFIAFSLATVSALADRKPFEATATTVGPLPISLNATGSNLSDFVSSLINTNGQFAPLNGRAYTASTSFLGVPNAIAFNTNATGTSVTYSLTPIGFSRTFTGATKQDVDDQIDEFYKKDGADVIAQFLKAIAEKSPLAVTDGNPNSATALAAGSTFTNQGFTSVDEFIATFDGNTTDKPRYGGFGLGFNAGHFKAAGFTGNNYDLSISGLNMGLGESVRLLTPISLGYLTVGGAKVAGAGINLALPIRFRVMNKDNPWNWRFTPLAGINLRGSADLAGGALLFQVGASNTLDYKVNPKLVVCMINQLTLHRSIGINYGDYSFDPKVDQQIAKNGFRLVSPLSRRVIGDFFIVDTRFFKAAAVKSFQTFGGSLSFRATPSFNLSLGANYDTGTDFKASSVGLSSAWRW